MATLRVQHIPSGTHFQLVSDDGQRYIDHIVDPYRLLLAKDPTRVVVVTIERMEERLGEGLS